MAGLGAPELLIVLIIILVVFGGSKLPQLARSLGSAKREFEHSSLAHDPAPKTQGEEPFGERSAQLAPLPVAREEAFSRPVAVPDGEAGRVEGTHGRPRHDAG